MTYIKSKKKNIIKINSCKKKKMCNQTSLTVFCLVYSVDLCFVIIFLFEILRSHY